MLQNCNTLFSFFLKKFLILFEKQQQSFPRSFGTVPFGSAVRLAQLMRTCGIYIGAQEDNSILLNPLMLTSRQVGIVCEALKQSMREMKREENKNGCN